MDAKFSILRSTHVPQKGQFETMRDKRLSGYKQKNHLRINVLNGLSWSFDVFNMVPRRGLELSWLAKLILIKQQDMKF